MRALANLSIAMFVIALCVAGCGGGDSSQSLTSNSSSSSVTSSSSDSCIASGGTNTGTSNVASVVIDPGPACAQQTQNGQTQGQINLLYVTVVVCAPGSTTNCQTIDHVQVDTGSYGLRIISEALQPALAAALPVVTQNGQTLNECTQFADGYSWGPLKTADMQIAGEKASSLEVQVIGDPNYPNVPTNCSNNGTQEDTVSVFGANGIIGIGPFVQECGPACAPGSTTATTNGIYYLCTPGGSCGPNSVAVALAQQMSNPVAFFPTDNNGTIIQLPALTGGAAATVQGQLIFGVDTATDNSSSNATTVLPADPNTGYISTVFNNATLNQSYIDSGSNALYFADSSLPQCQTNVGFYCPASETQLDANIEGINGTPSVPVQFNVGNADNLAIADSAADDLTGCPVSSGSSSGSNSNTCPTTSPTFDWGMPFFFGRNLYTVIACNQTGASCATTNQGYGPYLAF